MDPSQNAKGRGWWVWGGGVAEFEEFQIVPYRLQESLDIEFTGVKHKPLQIYIPPFKKTLY